MKGTEKELIAEVKENMSYLEALSEFIDNGFEHCNRDIHIDVDYKNNTISFSNDGYPIEHLNEIVSKFSTHVVQSPNGNNKDMISYFGKGFKKGFLKLGDMDNGCMIRIFSKNRNFTCYASIRAKYDDINDNCIKSDPMEIWKGDNVMDFKEGTLFEITNLSDGFWKMMDNHTDDEDDIDIQKAVASTLYLYCSDRYGLKSRLEGKNLYINGHKVEYTDYCRLENLGDKINQDGCYNENGVIYWVQTYEPKYNNESVRFKCVYTYVPRSTEEVLDDKKIICPFTNRELKKGDMGIVGYYTFRGNRIMDCGGNIREMFTDDLGISEKGIAHYHRGGANRLRVALFTDGALDFFGIKSNKGNGIEPLKKNEKLRKFKISGIPMYNILSRDAKSIAQFIKIESDKSSHTKELNVITADIIKEHCVTASEVKKENDRKRRKEKKNQNVQIQINSNGIDVKEILSCKTSDKVSEEIEGSDILTEREKNMLYAQCNMLKVDGKSNDYIVKFIVKSINTAEEYECRKTSNPTKRA